MLKRIAALSALLIPLSLATACTEDVGAGKVAAKAAEPAAVEPADAAKAAEARAVPVDAARSRVHALGAKITAKHPISFEDFDASYRVDGGAIVGVDVTVKMDSLKADDDKLTAHLKDSDFFDVERHPTATFKSAKIVAEAGDDGATHTVSGALTMHGVTQNISFPAKLSDRDGRLDTSAEFVINRKDYGISYPGMPDDLIQDNVVLTIELSADKPA
ncbi:MAG: YceI family protein [Myxococcales bacterium]|nr:YceI family protein [Myxococcales bacterium]